MSRVRKIARVTVTEPVDGTRRRRPPVPGRNGPVEIERVDPVLLAAASAALRTGERLLIVSTNEIRTVYR